MTGWLVFACTAAAGGVGAALRFVLDGLVRTRFGSGLPWGTALINLTGSFALGLLVGLAQHRIGADWVMLLGTGLLGGYTTFSTASVETVRLARDRRWRAATGYGFGVLVAGVALALLGIWVGSVV
ncbi:fluoride efflux transporter CrcB [Agromyces intestinalis]|uniref:Fluoride-specific ion channel FluC n=1 Tax=Agromyces intestinalis TaxID=2592652 RepID=A0A5C1YG93_9MICO|nr:fluoride efflux transporter CrcB [Agromyces intestinalis]QEO14638.1 fluoride efflux transporter CrcB [Agromyces intestinalis]